MPEFVFNNCLAWGSVFAAVFAALVFGPAIWTLTADLLDVLRSFCLFTFALVVMLQVFYFAGHAKFLEKTPYKGPRKQEQGNGNGGV